MVLVDDPTIRIDDPTILVDGTVKGQSVGAGAGWTKLPPEEDEVVALLLTLLE